MANKVFVYGTLKVGGYFAREFDKLREGVEKAHIKGTLFDLGHFPGVKLGGKTKVFGEVHEYSEDRMSDIIQRMDSIEGYNPNDPKRSLYLRKTVEAVLEDGTTEEVIVYEFARNTKGYEEVVDGNWKI